MSFMERIKGMMQRMFSKSQAKYDFNVTEMTSDGMNKLIGEWFEIYRGNPEWVDENEHIRTIKFAKSVCAETARLTNLALGIAFDGGRAEYMQQFSDTYIMPNIRKWVEIVAAVGTGVLKPSGNGVDFLAPWEFMITDYDTNGNIRAAVFPEYYTQKGRYYTKYEYHRFEDTENGKAVYCITNKAYVSKVKGKLGDPIELKETRWSYLKDEVCIAKKNGEPLDAMLFGVLRMPGANDADLSSPLGVSMFSDAVEELKDLDIAYSRNAEEIFDSARTALVDERLIELPATRSIDGRNVRPKIKMPRYVRNVLGNDNGEIFYQEINPQLNTDVRIRGINNQLSMIGYKCGYSNGYFVFDEKSGMVTATQVESDDRRTIQMIKDIRDALQKCLNDVFYAQSVFADLYGLAPVGNYEAHYDFGDITFNEQEDKMIWWSYVQAGNMPFWRYLVRFEGMSEDEARAIEAETQSTGGLFGEE